MARILWDKSPNPPLYVSERLHVTDWELGEAIRQEAILVAATALLYTMMEWSPMSTANRLGTSTTRSDQSETVRAFTTFRVVGDGLQPDMVTRLVRIVPTLAYAKGETYSR